MQKPAMSSAHIVTYLELAADFDKTLIERRRLLGIDRRFAAVLIIVTFVTVGLMRNPWLLASAPVLYLIIWWRTREDADAIDVYQQYKGQGDHYEPRPHSEQSYNLRPQGFGRRWSCY